MEFGLPKAIIQLVVVGIVSKAIALAQHVKRARAVVKGSSKSLHNVSAQLNAPSTSLHVVEVQLQIQTVEVLHLIST